MSARNLTAALRLLERRVMRGASVRERNFARFAITSAIEHALMEAHMCGRIYANGGEKANPGDEHRNMVERSSRAFSSAFERTLKELDAEAGR